MRAHLELLARERTAVVVVLLLLGRRVVRARRGHGDGAQHGGEVGRQRGRGALRTGAAVAAEGGRGRGEAAGHAVRSVVGGGIDRTRAMHVPTGGGLCEEGNASARRKPTTGI